jgi:hypothetical protein
MTEYADIDEVNKLRAEQENIDRALTILDDYDGTVSSVVIVPTMPIPPDMVASLATVPISMADPPQSMVAGIRSGLIQRYNQINQELRDLGVTGTPPDHQGGGPPTAETQPA